MLPCDVAGFLSVLLLSFVPDSAVATVVNVIVEVVVAVVVDVVVVVGGGGLHTKSL